MVLVRTIALISQMAIYGFNFFLMHCRICLFYMHWNAVHGSHSTYTHKPDSHAELSHLVSELNERTRGTFELELNFNMNRTVSCNSISYRRLNNPQEPSKKKIGIANFLD